MPSAFPRFRNPVCRAVCHDFPKKSKHYRQRFNQTEDDWHLGLADGFDKAYSVAAEAQSLNQLSMDLGAAIAVAEADAHRSGFAKLLLGLDRYKQGKLQALRLARKRVAEYRLEREAFF